MHPIVRQQCLRTVLTPIRFPCSSRILGRPPAVFTRRLTSKLPSILKQDFPAATLHKQWYTDLNLPYPWSTCWDRWEGLCLFYETVDGGTPKIDKLFKYVFDVPGVINPLAFIAGNSFDTFLFHAEGHYYLYDDGLLWVSDQKFGSHREFLERALEPDGRWLPAVDVERRPDSGRLDWDLLTRLPTVQTRAERKMDELHKGRREGIKSNGTGIDVRRWRRRDGGVDEDDGELT
ncbi:hypothetical protein B0H19DRAFT_1230374 [Mycena capillaripes]|nr:hypothetical protein B0H19DRAFT_1230374 [Mycena capillaripes]